MTATGAQPGLGIKDAVNCAFQLAQIRSPDDPKLKGLLSQAADIERALDAQGTDSAIEVASLVAMARATASGRFAEARCHAELARHFGLSVPVIGNLVIQISQRDKELAGDAYDSALRQLEDATPASFNMTAVHIIYFDDAVTLASLLDANAPRDDTTFQWRPWALAKIGLNDQATEALLEHYINLDPDRFEGELETAGSHLTAAAGGDRGLASRLLALLLERMGPRAAQLPLSCGRWLFDLLDTCMDADLARRFAGLFLTAMNFEGGPGICYRELVFVASNLDLQRAAAVLALEGYRSTGNQDCAELAVWKLAAAGRVDEAARLALDVPWQLSAQRDAARLIEMFKVVMSVARSETDLRELADRLEQLGHPADIEKELKAMRGRPAAQFRDAQWNALIQSLWDEGQTSRAIRTARTQTLAKHRSIAPLAVHVDLYLELGDFNQALELASSLRAQWPDHPIASFKLAQVYDWLARDEESMQLIHDSVSKLEQDPTLAPEILARWARWNTADALRKCDQALNDPAFRLVWDALRRLRDNLASREDG